MNFINKVEIKFNVQKRIIILSFHKLNRKNDKMKKWFRRLLVLLLVLFIAIQFIRPDTNNPEYNPKMDMLVLMDPPEEVSNVIRNACYDCHSHQTVYPWYGQVAPASWMVSHHVKEGREHLNFSNWGFLYEEEQEDAMEEMGEEVREGEMPLPGYSLVHPEARLSDHEKKLVANWANQYEDD